MDDAKMNNKKIGEEFDKFLAESLENEWVNFPYADDIESQRLKKENTVALILWRFLRKFSYHTCLFGWTEKRAFIADFLLNNPLAKENASARIVAKIEALPTTVWRKLLWRENIDFSDYEPCLRRLNFDQQTAIEKNYDDLFSNDKPVTPRVLKKSWRDRVKLFFGMMSPDKLLKEKYDDTKRNQSKGAYAFSLLGLDFGFSLYPHGDNDDQKITNQKWTRFFSVKEHINDFIVNKEDGKYWWLYKTARSNYAFYPNKKVQMKKHVCPGFWLTLFLHTLFWIVSPIALTITGLIISKYGFIPAALIPASFAFTMIIWIVVFVLRTIFNLFSRFTKNNKAIRVIGATIGAAALIALLLAFAFVVLFAIGKSIAGLSVVVGPLLSTAFVLSAAFYVMFFFTCVAKDDSWFEYKDIPKFVRFLLHLSVGSFIIVMLDKFVTTIIINFFVYLAQTFWEWYTSSLLLSNWLIFSFIFFGLFVYFCDMFINNEKRFANFQKTFTWLTRGFMAVTIVIFTILLIQNGTFHLIEFGLFPALLLSLLFLAVGLSFVMLDQVNRVSINEREMAGELLLQINDKIGGMAYKSYITRILKSKWLLPFTNEAKWQIVENIRSLAFTFFECDSDQREKFFNLMITNGSVNSIRYLNNKWKKIIGVNTNKQEKYLLIHLIINGLSLEEAIPIMERKRTTTRKAAYQLEKFGTSVAYPFKKIWQAVCWVFEKISQFFGTLKDLWDFFNKRCPFVTPPRYLD